MSPPSGPDPAPTDRLEGDPDEIDRELERLSRRGFTVAGAAGLATLAGWQWLRTRTAEGGMPWPLRRVIRLDERIARATYSPRRLAPMFPDASLAALRINGSIGMDGPLDVARWRLVVEGPGGAVRSFTLDQIKALPRHEHITELKCIEGWAQKACWARAAGRPRGADRPLAPRRPALRRRPFARRPLRVRRPGYARPPLLRRPRHAQRPAPADAARL